MRITVIGAGNSGLAMAAHLSIEGHEVTLWNRSKENIQDLLDNPVIRCSGVINGEAFITLVTDNLRIALANPEVIFVTTPAFSHADLAAQFAIYLTKPTTIILNPGRTFGALEFQYNFHKKNPFVNPIIAETQTILYTCRKINQNEVEIYALKQDVLVSTISGDDNEVLVQALPTGLRDKFIPAGSMIETSIGNVGMIMHCAPILLNTGWVERIKRLLFIFQAKMMILITIGQASVKRLRIILKKWITNGLRSRRHWDIRLNRRWSG